MGSTFDELEVARSNSVIRVASAVAFAILYYDYALTFSTEVERFWQRPCSRVSLAYYLNRGMALFGHLPVLYEFYGMHAQAVGIPCSTLQMYHQMLVGITQVVVAALQIYRLYALYESSRRILYSLLALTGVACAIAGWAISQTWHNQTHVRIANPTAMRKNCDLRMSAREGKRTSAPPLSMDGSEVLEGTDTCTCVRTTDLAIIWIAVLLCDTVFFALIVNRVVRRQRWRGGLFTLLLRDGRALLVCHLANIITCLPPFRGVSVTITNVIATTLIARVMLNLRDPALTTGSCWWGASDGGITNDSTGLGVYDPGAPVPLNALAVGHTRSWRS
ncbi:hypothetical protein C8Q80DRAFT_1190106 [Daedaleopsis nitida]|nr:hypothetical protein C8Q80DRAFT_1190106 [Daedaleopsis nitida]